MQYVLSRYKRLLPEYFLFMILYFILLYIRNSAEAFYWLRTSPLSFFGLQALGVGDHGHSFGATWYVSVLIICGALVYLLHIIFEGKVKYVLGIICAIGYMYLYVFNGSVICSWDNQNGIFSNLDIIRGLSDISSGALVYHVVNDRKDRKKMKFAWIIESVLFFLIALTAMAGINTFITLVIIMSCVYMGFSNRTKASVYQKKTTEFLSQISYAIYLNHALFVDFGIIGYLGIKSEVMEVAVYIICITLFSTITHYLLYNIVKRINGMAF